MFVFVNLWKFQTPTVPGSPGQNYERTRAKKSALQKLNERRASWALDQKQEKNSHPKPPNLNGSGDQLDPPPILSIPHIEHSDSPTSEHSEQAPISARKRWDSPSKTVVNNFQGTQNKYRGAYKDGPENIVLQKWTGQNRTGHNFFLGFSIFIHF